MDRMVLVVEDNAPLRKGLLMLLRAPGCGTAAAASVGEATAYLDGVEHQPTHLLLDLNLPDGLGTTVLRHLRARSLPIRVALLTGSSDTPLVEEARSLGVDGVFIKPPEWDEIVAWVAEPQRAEAE